MGSCITKKKRRKLHTVITAQLLRNCMAHQTEQTYDTQVKLGHSAIHIQTYIDLDKPSTYTHKDFCSTLLQQIKGQLKWRRLMHMCRPTLIQGTENIQTVELLVFNPLLVQFKTPLHGQKGCVFFSRHLNLRTTPETGLPSREKRIKN